MNATLEKLSENSAPQSLTCLPREHLLPDANLSQVWTELLEMYDLSHDS